MQDTTKRLYAPKCGDDNKEGTTEGKPSTSGEKIIGDSLTLNEKSIKPNAMSKLTSDAMLKEGDGTLGEKELTTDKGCLELESNTNRMSMDEERHALSKETAEENSSSCVPKSDAEIAVVELKGIPDTSKSTTLNQNAGKVFTDASDNLPETENSRSTGDKSAIVEDTVPSVPGPSKQDPLACDPAASESCENIQYDIWKLGKMTLLVKSNYDGFVVKDKNNKKGNENTVFYKIFPKIEYQSSFGVEEFSTSDLTVAWWDSFLAKNSHSLCIRIDPRSNEILRCEGYKCASLVGPNCPFKPRSSMKLLHNVLKEIAKQEESGKYMMVHNANELHACLYKAKEAVSTEKGGKKGKLNSGYNPISDYCEGWSVKDTNDCWLPIDTNIVLPIHNNLGQLPCLFPQSEQTAAARESNGSTKKQKKSNKKKNAAKQVNKKTIMNALKEEGMKKQQRDIRRSVIENYEDMDF